MAIKNILKAHKYFFAPEKDSILTCLYFFTKYFMNARSNVC